MLIDKQLYIWYIIYVPHGLGNFFKCLNQFKSPITVRLERGGNTMYAVVETGGKQYKVTVDQLVNVERLDANVGDKVDLKVLMIVDGDKVKAGDDVKKSVVEAEVVEHGKEKKIVVFKYKAKKNYRRTQGHRQPYTTLKIVSIK